MARVMFDLDNVRRVY